MHNPRLHSFIGGKTGRWLVERITPIAGETLAAVERIDIVQGDAIQGDAVTLPADSRWVLRGVTSNERYATRTEKADLVARQAGLGRPEATRSALIPIRKTAQWWALTQDERRSLFEEQSKHITIGMKYLPAIARRLHHCRDLALQETFDFITLFDYAPEHESVFDDMLAELRDIPEWKYIDREVDIRLIRAD